MLLGMTTRRTAAALALLVSLVSVTGASAASAATTPAPTELRITTLDVQALICEAATLDGAVQTDRCAGIQALDSAQDLIDVATGPFTTQF